MPGVILVNPHSGPDETSVEELAALFPGHRVEELTEKVKEQVVAAVATGPDFLAVAGGDGTIRCAAAQLADTPLALLPIPAGTRNHFARELGIDTLERAGAAATGTTRKIDVGEVNGEVFINNASVGVYPSIVRDREAIESRMPKQVAMLVAAWKQLRRLEKFNVTVDGTTSYRAWMVFVGNGKYGTSILDLSGRQRLDEGVLDVRVLRAEGKLARLRVVAALVAGRLESSPVAELDEAGSVELQFARASIDVALDGEVVRMTSPLRFRCRAGALSVLVPPEEASAEGG